MQIDPKSVASATLSVYHFANNNPVLFNDPLGNLVRYEIGEMIGSDEWFKQQCDEAIGGSTEEKRVRQNLLRFQVNQNTIYDYKTYGLPTVPKQ